MELGRALKKIRSPRDVVLITTLEDEYEATVGAIDGVDNSRVYHDKLHADRIANFEFYFPETQEITGTIIRPTGIGRTEAAIAVTIACQKLNPNIVMQVGIAGGFKFGSESPHHNKGLELGDVIVADEIVDLDLRRIGSERVKFKGASFSPERDIVEAALALSGEDWFGRIPKTISKGVIPSVHLGPVISGNIVLASDNFSKPSQ